MAPDARWREVKFEADLDPYFAEEIASLPEGERVFHCIQCGTCSASCPLSPFMQHTPRKIIAMIREGFRTEVLTSNTPWLCSSCYACTVECPKGIKITDVMYAAKRIGIREGIYPKPFLTPVLAREFFELVKRNGRSHEGELLLRMYMKTNPFELLKKAVLGIRLFLQGRIGLKRDKVKNSEQFRTLMKTMEGERMMKRREEIIAEKAAERSRES